MTRRFPVVKCGLIAMLASSLLVFGCGKETPKDAAKSTDANKAPEAAKPAEGPKPAEAPKPAAAGNPAAPSEQALAADLQASPALVKVENAGFESWGKKGPSGWNAKFASRIKKSADASEGKSAVELVPKADTFNYVSQVVKLDKSYAGKKVIVTAMAKSSAPDKALAWGSYSKDDVQIIGSRHPGDGQWHRVGVVIQLPPTVTDGQHVSFALENGPSTAPAMFDDVKVYVK